MSYFHINTYMNFGFDIISDLHLTTNSAFEWDNKATSLYCIIPGNISDDLQVVKTVLQTLSEHYQGIFYIDGSLENSVIGARQTNNKAITRICKPLSKVVYLHDNVVVIEGVALVGINGWYGNYVPENGEAEVELIVAGYEDFTYLDRTLDKLQLHLDVRKIVIISNSVPLTKLFYGEIPKMYSDTSPEESLENDTEHKVSHWVFGSSQKIIDTTFDSINYVNNPCYNRSPYYAKRIEIEF
jgi:hypothetical protein